MNDKEISAAEEEATVAEETVEAAEEEAAVDSAPAEEEAATDEEAAEEATAEATPTKDEPEAKKAPAKKKKLGLFLGIGAAVLVTIAVIAILLFVPKETPPPIDPGASSLFAIPITVNEATAYAGIEFALRLSDESAAVFESFTPALEGAIISPFMERDGLHYFGYFAGSNAFPEGEMVVGTLNFTDYVTGTPLTITVELMTVTRLTEDKTTVSTTKDSPAFVFEVEPQ